jgi:hypothetical protein
VRPSERARVQPFEPHSRCSRLHPRQGEHVRQQRPTPCDVPDAARGDLRLERIPKALEHLGDLMGWQAQQALVIQDRCPFDHAIDPKSPLRWFDAGHAHSRTHPEPA